MSNDTTTTAATSLHQLDDLDRAIIRHLCSDGRKPWQTIAEELNVDEKTVRNRVNRLREKNLLRLLPAMDGNHLENCLVVLLAIRADPAYRTRLQEIAREIAELPVISWVGVITGRWHIVAEAVLRSARDLAPLKLEQLAAIPGISEVEELIVLSHHGRRGVPFVPSIVDPSS